MKLKNKTALVTGSSTGIGREIAVALASQGCRIALVGRNKQGLQQTKRQIKTKKGKAEIFLADLTCEKDINNLAKNILKKWKRIDIIANVAGVWHDKNKAYYGLQLQNTPIDQIHEVLDVGIKAPILLTRLLIPLMIAKKQGKIINISGTFESGAKGWLHYYVSKKAIENFTVGLAEELRPFEIQVNCISPSDTATSAYKKLFPKDAKTALNPKEIAKFALFLVSKDSDHITGSCTILKNKKVHSTPPR